MTALSYTWRNDWCWQDNHPHTFCHRSYTYPNLDSNPGSLSVAFWRWRRFMLSWVLLILLILECATCLQQVSRCFWQSATSLSFCFTFQSCVSCVSATSLSLTLMNVWRVVSTSDRTYSWLVAVHHLPTSPSASVVSWSPSGRSSLSWASLPPVMWCSTRGRELDAGPCPLRWPTPASLSLTTMRREQITWRSIAPLIDIWQRLINPSTC